MSISAKQKRGLRSKAHHLKPIITVGAGGVSESVISELDRSLDHHELLKIKVQANDRSQRQVLVQSLCDTSHSELVHAIGHVVVVYRQRPDSSDDGQTPNHN